MAFASTLLATGLRTYLNGKYERYGQVQELSLDMDNRTIEALVLLSGEETPITLSTRYSLAKDADGQPFLNMREVRLSKPWMQALLDDRSPEGIKVKLPPNVAGILSMVG